MSLSSWFEVNEIALNWLDRVNFILSDDFSFKGIKLSEAVADDESDSEIESKQQRFDTDFFIMTETFSGLLKELLELFKATKSDKSADETASEEVEMQVEDV